MLDILDHTKHDTMPNDHSNTAGNSPAAPLDEAIARIYLAQHTGADRPSVRALAAEWHWSKSRVDRFIDKFERDTTGQQRDNAPEPTVEDRRRLMVNGLADFDKRITAADDAKAIENLLASVGDQPNDDDFDWTAKNDDIVATSQRSIAVYQNQFGQIVIRSEGSYLDQDNDAFVCKPRQISGTEAAKPWLAEEISRASWYRRRQHQHQVRHSVPCI